MVAETHEFEGFFVQRHIVAPLDNPHYIAGYGYNFEGGGHFRRFEFGVYKMQGDAHRFGFGQLYIPFPPDYFQSLDADIEFHGINMPYVQLQGGFKGSLRIVAVCHVIQRHGKMIRKRHYYARVQFDLQRGFAKIHNLACQKHVFVRQVGEDVGEAVYVGGFLRDKHLLNEAHINFRPLRDLKANSLAKDDDLLSVVIRKDNVIIVLPDISHFYNPCGQKKRPKLAGRHPRGRFFANLGHAQD
jgi:hypothetical protein